MDNDNTVIINLRKFNKVIRDGDRTKIATFLDLHTAIDIANEVILAFCMGMKVELNFTNAGFTIEENMLASGGGFKKILLILCQYYQQEFIDEHLTITAGAKDLYLYQYIYKTSF